MEKDDSTFDLEDDIEHRGNLFERGARRGSHDPHLSVCVDPSRGWPGTVCRGMQSVTPCKHYASSLKPISAPLRPNLRIHRPSLSRAKSTGILHPWYFRLCLLFPRPAFDNRLHAAFNLRLTSLQRLSPRNLRLHCAPLSLRF